MPLTRADAELLHNEWVHMAVEHDAWSETDAVAAARQRHREQAIRLYRLAGQLRKMLDDNSATFHEPKRK